MKLKWWFWPIRIFILAILVLLFLAANHIAVNSVDTTTKVDYRTIVTFSDLKKLDLYTLTNGVRVSNGSGRLNYSVDLELAAQAKCADMVKKDYWAHKSPEGLETWVFMKNQGIAYKKAGENLAQGQSSSQEVINQWMKSPEHRPNMLNKEFTDVGFGVCYSPKYLNGRSSFIIVQNFAQM